MALEILIVDDERDIRELVAGVLGDEGYECRTAADSTSALAARPSACTLEGFPTTSIAAIIATRASPRKGAVAL